MIKNILVVSYVFPPYPGIGGRRWAKFAKYLSKRGYTIHVVCAKNPFPESSAWLPDVHAHPNIIRHELPPRYPTILLKKPTSIGEKISYRVGEKVLWGVTRGNIYERSLFWRSPFLKTASRLIRKHSIRTVVVSGAPFHVLHHALELKNLFRDITLISDFRDQWTENKSLWGFHCLSKGRLDFEKGMERDVVSQSDVIVTTAEEWTRNLQALVPSKAANFVTIHNGYDGEDVAGIRRVKQEGGKIIFVLAGTLYSRLGIFDAFLQMLIALKHHHRNIYDRLVFRFYGTQPAEYVNAVRTLGLEAIGFFPSISLKESLQKIANGDYGILFLNDDYTFNMSTKFMDYIALKKKIVAFSQPGDLIETIEKNQIGYGCSPPTMKESFLRICEAHDQGGANFNENFDSTSFSISKLTDEWEKLFR